MDLVVVNSKPEFRKIEFSIDRGGRLFIQATINIIVFHDCEAGQKRTMILGRANINSWVKEQVLNHLNEKPELLKLYCRRYGDKGKENMIRCFLSRRLPEIGACLDSINVVG